EIPNRGSIKFATNIGTIAKDIRYLIPTLQRRLSEAEQNITSDSIVHTVLNSVEYSLEMQKKANVEDLGDLATRGELEDLAENVEGKISDAIDSIDFEPYVTKSELEQTATDITAKFSATGGMNLLRNS